MPQQYKQQEQYSAALPCSPNITNNANHRQQCPAVIEGKKRKQIKDHLMLTDTSTNQVSEEHVNIYLNNQSDHSVDHVTSLKDDKDGNVKSHTTIPDNFIFNISDSVVDETDDSVPTDYNDAMNNQHKDMHGKRP